MLHSSQSPASCLISAAIPGQKRHSRARRTMLSAPRCSRFLMCLCMTYGTITRSPLNMRPSRPASSSRIEKYDAITVFTSALLSDQPARMDCFSVSMWQFPAIAVRRRLRVDCPIEDYHVTSDGHVTSWYTPYWRSSHQCQAISEMRIIHVDMCVKRLG